MGTVGLPMLLACGGLSRLPCDLVAPGAWTWKLSGARSWFPAGPLHPGIGGEMGIPRQVGGGSPLAPSEGKATEQARHEPASTLLGQGQGRRTSAPAVGSRGGVGRLCGPCWQMSAWGCVSGAAALLRPEDSPSGGQGRVEGGHWWN